MSDGDWNKVLNDCKRARKESWGEDYIWMEKLVSLLLEKRDLSRLYPITSHFRLIVFVGKQLREKYNKPKMSILLSDKNRPSSKEKYRYLFSLRNGSEGDGLYRESVESVYCSFEKSLEVFDEMFEKLKAATEKGLTIK